MTMTCGKLLIFFGVVLFLTSCETTSETQTAPIRWQLAWSDEFSGGAGTSPDPKSWTFDEGGDGWGNNQLEHNTARTSNVALDGDGHLAIVARKEDYKGNAYTSARIKTQGLRAFRYGRIEARIKLPVGKGMWPAFWMLGSDIAEVGWPKCGEIDVMEYRGDKPKVVHGSVHGPGYSAGDAITRKFRLDDGAAFDADFHVFAVEWDPARITWSVDDVVYHTLTVAKVKDRGAWAFDHKFFLLLNIAVGGVFSGDPDDSTVFPQTMLVDYVRTYTRAP